MEDITDKWLIRGLDNYFFGNDKNLYKKPCKSGRNYYGLKKLKKQTHNRYYINGKLVSEKQLRSKIIINLQPQVWITKNDMPF
jgi:hypothetical protein